MRVTIYAAVLLTILCTCPSRAAFITQSQVVNMRFMDAAPGVPAEPESLRFGAEAADTIVVLDLGEYSSTDAGKTLTIMRESATNAQWDAIASAMRQGGDPFNRNTGLPTMWLGTDELEEKEIGSSGDLSRGRLSAGFPTYNLQRVDITVRYYRTGNDDGIAFRTAAFDAVFYWLIPEPATWVLAVVGGSLLAIRRRRVRARCTDETTLWHLRKPFVAVSLVLLCFARTADAEIITVPFSGIVTEVVGDPFGIMAQVGVTTVSGSFAYDPATEPYSTGTNFGRFVAPISRGFVMNIQGVTISSSEYVLSTSSNVLNHGGSDLFGAGADPDGRGRDFQINNIPTRGSADVDLWDTDQLLFAANADALMLPPPDRLAHIDFITGFISDDFNYIAFRSIPEPSELLLATLAIGWLKLLRRRVPTC